MFGNNAKGTSNGLGDLTFGILSFLNYLPVSKIRIVVSEWGQTTNDRANDVDVEESHHGYYTPQKLCDQIESAVCLWKSLGNSIESVDGGHGNTSHVGFL